MIIWVFKTLNTLQWLTQGYFLQSQGNWNHWWTSSCSKSLGFVTFNSKPLKSFQKYKIPKPMQLLWSTKKMNPQLILGKWYKYYTKRWHMVAIRSHILTPLETPDQILPASSVKIWPHPCLKFQFFLLCFPTMLCLPIYTSILSVVPLWNIYYM